jgi:signal transduction histidine kinase
VKDAPPEEVLRLLSTSPDGLVVVDARGTVRYANPAANELYQRGDGSLVGESFGMPHVAGVHDVELVLPDGTLRTVELRAVETTWAGEAVWVIALRDTTVRRRHEEELLAALAAGGDLPTDLTNELAHELATPLVVIAGFTDMLEGRWADLTDSVRRDLVHRIGRQARRLQRMLRRILLASDATSPAALEPVPLWEVALAHLPDLGVPGVEIDCPHDLQVLADPTHVDEIVVNLVENAAKYGAPPILVQARRRGDTVELSVCDQGPGVPASFVPRVFDRYTRAEAARSRPGAGLGLNLVARLAEASGGHVRYEPNTPHGARFVVTLPAA